MDITDRKLFQIPTDWIQSMSKELRERKRRKIKNIR